MKSVRFSIRVECLSYLTNIPLVGAGRIAIFPKGNILKELFGQKDWSKPVENYSLKIIHFSYFDGILTHFSDGITDQTNRNGTERSLLLRWVDSFGQIV